MAIEDRIADFLEDPEARAQGLRWAWYLSLGFLLVGYGIILYKLFY